jgi:uncharacterized protein (TIRG00374 family)
MIAVVICGNAVSTTSNRAGGAVVARQVAIGVVVGSVALWLTFRGVDWGELQAALKGIDPTLTFAALVLNLGALLVMIVRWQVFLSAAGQGVAFGPAFRAMVVGQMANILVPLRLGEIVRVHALSQRAGIGRTEILVTIAVEKLLDAALFGGSLLLVGALALPAVRALRPSWTFGASAILLGLLLWAISSNARPVVRGLTAMAERLPGRIGRFTAERVRRVVAGVAAVRTPRAGASVAGLSVAMVVLSTLTNYLLFRAFHLDLSLMAAFTLLLLLKAASVPPSLPGKLGTMNFVTAFALGLYGVSEPAAIGYAVVLYVITILPKILIGMLYVADRSLWLRAPAVAS